MITETDRIGEATVLEGFASEHRIRVRQVWGVAVWAEHADRFECDFASSRRVSHRRGAERKLVERLTETLLIPRGFEVASRLHCRVERRLVLAGDQRCPRKPELEISQSQVVFFHARAGGHDTFLAVRPRHRARADTQPTLGRTASGRRGPRVAD